MKEAIRRLVPAPLRPVLRRANALVRFAMQWARLRVLVSMASPLRIMLGSGGLVDTGFISTDQDVLDITRGDHFSRLLKAGTVDSFFAEHVFEHLDEHECATAFALCFRYLKPGGCLRVAVPDGNRPDAAYRAEVAPPRNGHRQLFTVGSLCRQLSSAGFRCRRLEWCDEEGTFHCVDWDARHGAVRRSLASDRQEAFRIRMAVVRHGREDAPAGDGRPSGRAHARMAARGRNPARREEVRYTSLIVDAVKPGEESPP